MSNRQPLGLRPKVIVDQERYWEISLAITRYASVSKPIPKEWTDELNEISSRIVQQPSLDVQDATSGKDWRIEMRRLAVLVSIVLTDTVNITPDSERAFRQLESDGLITVTASNTGYNLAMTKEGQAIIDKLSAVLGFTAPYGGKRYSLNCNQTMIILDCYRGTSTQTDRQQFITDTQLLIKRGILKIAEPNGYELTDIGRQLALTILTVSVL